MTAPALHRPSIKSISSAEKDVMRAREALKGAMEAAKAARAAKIGSKREMRQIEKSKFVKTLKKDFLMSERLDIAARQLWKCYICQLLLPGVFEIDHIVPRHLNGPHSMENACATCPLCHRTKTRKERQDWAHAQRALRAASKAKKVSGQEEEEEEEEEEEFTVQEKTDALPKATEARPPRRGAAIAADQKIKRIRENERSTPAWDFAF